MPVSQSFQWSPQPEAFAILDQIVSRFLDRCAAAGDLARRLRRETGTRFFDWIDFIEVPDEGTLRKRLSTTGFVPTDIAAEGSAFHHPGALFPTVLLSGAGIHRVGLKVDSVSDFLAAHNITNDHKILGEPYATMRRVLAFSGDGAELWVVERHGSHDLAPAPVDADHCMRSLHHFECLRRRKRDWENEDDGWKRLSDLLDASIADLGKDATADLFFRAERDYWQRRNRAGRMQKARQDVLGLGWGNHDHHTFRCSRERFHQVVGTLEKVGFFCRERFYAGHEAGWGAQVMEQPHCGLVVFADVDLSPEEVSGDFAHSGLTPRDFLGTVGIWCGLHGDSMMLAGMHHLEAQFDFDLLRDQLSTIGIETMDPFTDMPFLRQAFTEGERWKVPEKRVNKLLAEKLITPAQANQFLMQGAIGSHLENLQREYGYKGFNQHAVSDIIRRTDPRTVSLRGG